VTELRAEFEVLEVIEIEDLGVVLCRGHARGGTISVGMNTRVLAFSQLYMRASISGVKYDGDLTELRFDMPDPDIREQWMAFCRVGDVLPIEM
jgi:hypothetical protein